MSTTLTVAVLLAHAASPRAPEAPPSASSPDTNTEIIVVGQAGEPITIEPRGLSVSLGETDFGANTSQLLILDTRVTWDSTDRAQPSVGIHDLANDRAWAFHPCPQRTTLVELRWTR